MALTPTVDTSGPAGGFQLGSSQGASAELASRLMAKVSPDDERLRYVSSGVYVSGDGSAFHSLRNFDGPAAVDL